MIAAQIQPRSFLRQSTTAPISASEQGGESQKNGVYIFKGCNALLHRPQARHPIRSPQWVQGRWRQPARQVGGQLESIAPTGEQIIGIEKRFDRLPEVRQRQENGDSANAHQCAPTLRVKRTSVRLTPEQQAANGFAEQQAKPKEGHEYAVLHIHQQVQRPEQTCHDDIVSRGAVHRSQQIKHKEWQELPTLDVVMPQCQVDHAIAGKCVDQAGDEGGKMQILIID